MSARLFRRLHDSNCRGRTTRVSLQYRMETELSGTRTCIVNSLRGSARQKKVRHDRPEVAPRWEDLPRKDLTFQQLPHGYLCRFWCFSFPPSLSVNFCQKKKKPKNQKKRKRKSGNEAGFCFSPINSCSYASRSFFKAFVQSKQNQSRACENPAHL